MLLCLGAALIALGAVLAKHEVVASVFAFSGVATALLGVLLSRLEGSFEVSPTRLVGTLKEMKTASVRDDLTFEERANILFKLLGVSGEEGGRADRTPAEAPAPQTTPTVALPQPTPFVATGEANQAEAVGQAFERHVEARFRQDGWKIESERTAWDMGFDFKAVKGDLTVYVEVKLRRRLGAADARALLGAVHRHGADSPGAIWVMAVNAGALSAAARKELAWSSDVFVLEFPVEGW